MTDSFQAEERQRGLEAFARSDFRTAILGLAHAATHPADLDARCKLGWAQSECGMVPAALATLSAAVQDAPEVPEVYFYRALIYWHAGSPAQADADLQQVLRLQPDHPEAATWLQALNPTAARYRAAPRAHARAPAAISTSYLVCGLLLGGCFLVGAFVLSVGLGQRHLEHEFPTQQVLTYQQFVQQKPTRGWFRITGAALSVEEASWLESRKFRHTASNVYIPVRAADEDPSKQPVYLLTACRDEAIKKTIQEMADHQRLGQTDALQKAIEREPQRYWIEKDVEGLISDGLSGMDERKSRAVLAQSEVAPGFQVLKTYVRDPQGTIVTLKVGSALCGGSLALALPVVGLALWRRRRLQAKQG